MVLDMASHMGPPTLLEALAREKPRQVPYHSSHTVSDTGRMTLEEPAVSPDPVQT